MGDTKAPKWRHPGGKLRELGAESLTDVELLAILIGTGTKGRSAEDIAEEVLEKFGGFKGITNESLEELLKVRGLANVKTSRVLAALEYAKRLGTSKVEQGKSDVYPKTVSDEKQVVLFDNVQFIYELALSQLELEALGVQFEVTNGLREFRLLNEGNFEKLKRRVAYFKSIKGKLTDYYYLIRRNRTRSVNQYLTHWIYPYKGKFHPQMIRALLNIIGLNEGDAVLDPFIGSGTTAVEAQLLGINCIGIDISPLCVLQSKVKTESIAVLEEILACKKELVDKIQSPLFNVEHKTLEESIESIPNEKVRNFYRLAQLLSISDVVRRRRDFTKAFCKNVEMMSLSVGDYCEIVKELNLELGKVDIKTGDSKNLPLPDESMDGIITSPPYSIALDYIKNDAHALKALGFNLPELREKFIGVRGKGPTKMELYNQDMKESFNEMFRVLKPENYAVIVIGNATYLEEEVKTVEFTIDYMESIGFKLVNNIDKIIFGLYNVMQKENILIFKKAGVASAF